MSNVHFQAFTFTHSASGRELLKDINAFFPSGSFNLVFGPSGSGKSMLLRCINGLIPNKVSGKCSGLVKIGDQLINDIDESVLWKKTGSVFQEPIRQMVASTVSNEIAFSLENQGVSRETIKQSITRIADQLQIKDLLPRKVSTLSGGEIQKVAIASVLVSDPEILLLDEPIASLDYPSARLVVDFLKDLVQYKKKTIICAEHRVEPFGESPNRLQLCNGKNVVAQSSTEINNQEALQTLDKCNRAGQPIIKISSLTYGLSTQDREIEILKDVNLEIWRGDRIALLGHNGAGKSTLIRHLIGLAKPKSGSITIDNKSLVNMTVAEASRYIGYVCQSPTSMIFESSVRREIGFALKQRRESESVVKKRVCNVAEALSITNLLDNNPFLLSLGQKRLVCVAAISILDPKAALILDEPTASLDLDASTKLLNHVFRQANKNNLAVLFSTHDLKVAERFSNRWIVLNQGKVVADGHPNSILQSEILSKYNLGRIT